MFTTEYRQEVTQFLLDKAKSDKRISSAAIVGSFAASIADRWSDVDITLGVNEAFSANEVLADWTKNIVSEFQSDILFDLYSNGAVYRVFLLDGCLQVDISFAPQSKFGAIGPNFKLLFGSTVEKSHLKSPSSEELFGYVVHHIVRAHFCIKRKRYWQAEYWLSAGRDKMLTLLCTNSGLNFFHGRGFDELPPEILNQVKDSFVRFPEKEELIRSLGNLIKSLLNISFELKLITDSIIGKLNQLLDWISLEF